ncbi:hypothetical protein QBC47DRAFT_392980 [Echria macrotheca]|uniref:Uncharacterized protein n=1 Tax=Echria macrotheca TaxID=438768 RepID=A0AAJ0B4A3_9PEZI|nr:hypothetical protein QBC47DRAFT_392980 [Echria macrotheca]
MAESQMATPDDREKNLLDISASYDRSIISILTNIQTRQVTDAIAEGKRLRLGVLWDPSRSAHRVPYGAVFVWDGCVGEEDFVFTASCHQDISKYSDLKDLDRHVSFLVDKESITDVYDGNGWTSRPVLRIRQWISGLCFFRGSHRIRVVFPWPEDLAMIGRS